MHDLWSLELHEALPRTGRLDHIEFGANLGLPGSVAVAFSTQLPGGFWDMQVGIDQGSVFAGREDHYALLHDEPTLKPFAHAVLRYGAEIVFEGRVQVLEYVGGQLLAFTALGYHHHLNDGWYQNDSSSTVTSGMIIEDVLRRAAPLLRPAMDADNWVDPGISHAYNEFDEASPAQIINQLTAEGDAAARLVDMMIWQGRVMQVRRRQRPATPHYQIEHGPNVTYTEDYSEVYGRAKTIYTDFAAETDDETAFANTTGFSDRYPLRTTALEGGTLTDAAAVALRDTFLEEHSAPVVSISAAFPEGETITTPSGVPVPGWLVRAGQWIQVGNKPAQIIVRTRYDCNRDELQIEAGSFPQAQMDVMLGRLQKAVAELARERSPVSGARRR